MYVDKNRLFSAFVTACKYPDKLSIICTQTAATGDGLQNKLKLWSFFQQD